MIHPDAVPAKKGKKRGKKPRGPVLRYDDPSFKFDIGKRPKSERIQASRDGYLRATSERQKWTLDEFGEV